MKNPTKKLGSDSRPAFRYSFRKAATVSKVPEAEQSRPERKAVKRKANGLNAFNGMAPKRKKRKASPSKAVEEGSAGEKIAEEKAAVDKDIKEKESGEEIEFKHDPLDTRRRCIRIISILPGTGDIQWHIQTIELDSASYTAVSYVWGAPEPAYRIFLNGRPFHVRENLYRFLLQARDNEIFDSLWIDAVCIAQSNVRERNHQVTQMGSIFRNARRVISWLGQGDERVGQFLRLVPDVLKEVEDVKAYLRSVNFMLDFTGPISTNLLCDVLKKYARHDVDFLKLPQALSSLGYFSRTWVIQEVLLAPDFHVAMYENMTLDWADLMLVTRHIFKALWTPANEQGPVAPFLTPRMKGNDSSTTESPIDVICKFAKTQCSDLRDHVFALRELWDQNEVSIEVDYNITPAALFWKIAKLIPSSKCPSISTFFAIAKMLHLQPPDILDAREQCEQKHDLAISVDFGYSYKPRNSMNLSDPVKVSDWYRICTCGLCVQVPIQALAPRAREVLLFRNVHLVQIDIYPKMCYGIAETLERSLEKPLLILPFCLNETVSSYSPAHMDDVRIETNRLSLSSGSICELLIHLRSDQFWKDGAVPDEGDYWGIDCSKHDEIDPKHARKDKVDEGKGIDEHDGPWTRERWRRSMRAADRENRSEVKAHKAECLQLLGDPRYRKKAQPLGGVWDLAYYDRESSFDLL